MRAGWPVVVGSRGVALAPVPRVAGAVIVDADDEAYRSEATPTWDALSMLRERCRRDEAPLWATTVLPSPSTLHGAEYRTFDGIAKGWPTVRVVNRRDSDPRDGVLSGEAVDAAHRALLEDHDVAVVVILQRLGHGRLFACRKCGELARCEECGLAEEEVDGQLTCSARHVQRANYCRSCGATNLRRVQVGVASLARDVAAQLAQPVSEITAKSTTGVAFHRVVVGTEAVFQRVRHCGVVVFVDFDQYLLAPRESARRSAITAVAKAGRLVGARGEGGGEVILQTRRSKDPVVKALVDGEFDDVVREDDDTARILGLPLYGAIAQVSGVAAGEFVVQFERSGVGVFRMGDVYELRAPSVSVLTETLRNAERPEGKLRVAVL